MRAHRARLVEFSSMSGVTAANPFSRQGRSVERESQLQHLVLERPAGERSDPYSLIGARLLRVGPEVQLDQIADARRCLLILGK